MSGSVNSVFLVGHLGKDPETRITAGGQSVCNFSMATSRKYKDRDDNLQEKTEWHRIVCWGKLAETCDQYLVKGRQVCVRGSIESREWTDKDGNKRVSFEIKADEVTFLGPAGGDKPIRGAAPSGRSAAQPAAQQKYADPTSGPWDEPPPAKDGDVPW